MPVIFECELCNRTEHEIPLLHYPIHVTYKEVVTLMEHADSHAVVCVECLATDLYEG